MKDFTSLSNLKFRIGYGETGNQDIGNNSYMTLLGKGYVYILETAWYRHWYLIMLVTRC